MEYTFEILGVSPTLQFFTYQQEVLIEKPQSTAAYLGSYKCTLDSLLESVETVTPKRGWNLDRVADTVISFWVNNIDSIRHWKQRLEDAGDQNLLISRVADYNSLQTEFEWLLKQ